MRLQIAVRRLAQKVNDENYQRHHKQVDQAAGHVETEAEKPKNQKHHEKLSKPCSE